ncbi:MAG: hypothetical protein FVQ84_08345 [Planctomycetes bacterium]|nr:hypothetical protein [Planctomycetota bacterium]
MDEEELIARDLEKFANMDKDRVLLHLVGECTRMQTTLNVLVNELIRVRVFRRGAIFRINKTVAGLLKRERARVEKIQLEQENAKEKKVENGT